MSRAPSVADLTALSRFACSDWFMSLSGYGCCAFGGARSLHTLPVGLNGESIIQERKFETNDRII